MDYEALAREITGGPRAQECARYLHTNAMAKLAGDEAHAMDQAIADILNAAEGTRYRDFNVNARTLLSVLGAVVASTILDKLEAAAQASSPVKWAMRFIDSTDGINLGDPQTIGMLELLSSEAGGNVLTEEEVQALLALVRVPSSRAIEAVGCAVTADDVSVAVRGNGVWLGV